MEPTSPEGDAGARMGKQEGVIYRRDTTATNARGAADAYKDDSEGDDMNELLKEAWEQAPYRDDSEDEDMSKMLNKVWTS